MSYCMRPASGDEMEEIFRIRYVCYLKSGLVRPNVMQKVSDCFDELSASKVYVATRKEVIVGTMRLVCDSPYKLPSDNEFPDIIQSLRQEDRVLAELCKFAMLGESSIRLFIDFMLYTIKETIRCNSTDMLVMAAGSNVQFYMKLFPFINLSSIYSSAYDKHLSLLKWDLTVLDKRLKQAYIYKKYPKEMERLFMARHNRPNGLPGNG